MKESVLNNVKLVKVMQQFIFPLVQKKKNMHALIILTLDLMPVQTLSRVFGYIHVFNVIAFDLTFWQKEIREIIY